MNDNLPAPGLNVSVIGGPAQVEHSGSLAARQADYTWLRRGQCAMASKPWIPGFTATIWWDRGIQASFAVAVHVSDYCVAPAAMATVTLLLSTTVPSASVTLMYIGTAGPAGTLSGS